MFKVNWEKTSTTHSLPEGMVEKMVHLACPNKKLISHELITGGCANLNIKILLEDKKNPFILRVYLRDKEAAYREHKLTALFKRTVPVPLTHSIGKLESYLFAITEFMPGVPLRDLLLGNTPHDLSAIMYEVGKILSKITAHEFSRAGFFDHELNLIPHSPSDDWVTFGKDCLKHKTVLSVLTSDVICQISQVLNQYGHLFPNKNEKHLVHGDFDPANILVHKVDHAWKVSGVLDWEFSFSGPILCDVASMLRYAHKMPPEFQNSFLKGLASGGVSLPKNCQTTVNLLNLLSLLDCLRRSNTKTHPNQISDILKLIDRILSELNSISKIGRIEIEPYNSQWPSLFEAEALKIKKALAHNCLAIHHVGSTSVLGLAAKPMIDMIAVVRDLFFDQSQLEAIGYKYRGGFNIPLRRSFTIRTADRNMNLHVFEEKDPEIELNLLFRDYLRNHSEARNEYALLKYQLITEASSHEKRNSIFRGYTLGKNDFIKKILIQAGFNQQRFVLCTHHSEWNSARYFRDQYFFGPHGIEDPYTWTFNHAEHAHLVFYQGTEMIGYAHIQFWPNHRAAIRIMVIDEHKRNQNAGSQFLALNEKWLKSLGIKSIHLESRRSSLRFYLKNGYTEMSFNDPESHESDPNDVPVGKLL